MLVTKAGPATICEACLAGLPIILSGAVPGQEDGNIEYVVRSGAGVYAPGPARVAEAVGAWLAAGPERLAAHSAKARTLGQPNAAFEIAEEIHAQAQTPPIRTHFHTRRSARPRLRPTPEDGWVY
jgi:1,2-diacylglycerol 3-beta-galactosyltransferase